MADVDDDNDFGDLYVDDDKVNLGVTAERGHVVQDSGSDSDEGNGGDGEDDIRIVFNVGDVEGDETIPGEGLETDEGFKYPKLDRAVGNVDNKCNVSQDDDMLSSKQQNLEMTGNKKLKPCSPYHLGIPVATRNGFNYSLPHNRTIFDISIEELEWKPWRNSGVDVTDFFNFNLNEESWKGYCKKLEKLRRQTTTVTRFSSVGNFSSNQTCDSKFLHGDVATEYMTCEMEGVCASEIDKPMGQAIQVEDGVGGRTPSVSIKHPGRNQDSDVVIQVKMEGYAEDACCPEHLEVVHRERFFPQSDNMSFDWPATAKRICKVLSSNGCNQKSELVDTKDMRRCHKITSSITNEVLLDLQDQPESNEHKANCSVMVGVSNHASELLPNDKVLCNISPCFDSESAGASFDESHSPNLHHTLTEFQESAMANTSDQGDSTDATSISEHHSIDSSDHNCTQNEWKNGRIAQRLSAVKVPRGYNDCSSRFLKPSPSVMRCARDFDSQTNQTSDSKNNMPSNQRNRRFTKNLDTVYSHIQNFGKEDEPWQCIRRNSHRGSYSSKERAIARNNYMLEGSLSHEQRTRLRSDHSKQIDAYFHRRSQSVHESRAGLCEKPDLMSKTSFTLQENLFRKKRKKIRIDEDARMKFGFYDVEEDKYEECMSHERSEMDVQHFVQEKGTIHDVYHRNVSYKAREPAKKEKWDHSLGFEFDLDHSKPHFEEDYKFKRASDQMSLVFQTDEEYSTMGRRVDKFSLKNHLYNSQQLRENHPNISSCYAFEEKLPRKNSDGYFFGKNRKQCHTAFNREFICFEKGTCFNDGKERHISCHRQMDWLDDDVGLKHHIRSGLTPFYRSSTCDGECSMYKLDGDGPTDDCFLNNYGREIIGKESKIFRRVEKYDLECGKGISRHSGVLEEKLQRRHRKVASKMRKQDITCTRVPSKEDSSSAGKLHLQDISTRNMNDKNACGGPQRSKGNRLQSLAEAARQTTMQLTENNAISGDPYFSEPEEGQLIEEDEVKGISMVANVCDTVATHPSKDSKPPKPKGKKSKPGKGKQQKAITNEEEERILTMLAKMEKRRERFKDPGIRKEPEKSEIYRCGFVREKEETAKERPARKRRWGVINSVGISKD